MIEDVKFQHLGLDCIISYNEDIGIYCGYVEIPENHPLYKKAKGGEYDNFDFHVHGGITFSGQHPLLDQNKVFVGFDCGHAGDIMKGIGSIISFPGSSFRDENYVRKECEHLAEQIKGDSK